MTNTNAQQAKGEREKARERELIATAEKHLRIAAEALRLTNAGLREKMTASPLPRDPTEFVTTAERQALIDRYGYDPAERFADLTRAQLEQALAAANAVADDLELRGRG